jgi:tetratricopeptide (TPR) repeat protein
MRIILVFFLLAYCIKGKSQDTGNQGPTIEELHKMLEQQNGATINVVKGPPHHAAGGAPSSAASTGYLAQYRLGRSLQDWGTASQALVGYLTANPSGVAYQDTLLDVYTLGQNWTSAMLLSQHILATQPQNLFAQEKLAQSYEQLNLLPQAQEAYKKLYEQSFRPLHLYYLAHVQYKAQQQPACEASLKEVLQHPATARTTLTLAVNALSTETVPLAAAAHNLLGYMWQQQGKLAEARKAYDTALQLAPTFSLAKGNRSTLKP